jgi:hypothetical protein
MLLKRKAATDRQPATGHLCPGCVGAGRGMWPRPCRGAAALGPCRRGAGGRGRLVLPWLGARATVSALEGGSAPPLPRAWATAPSACSPSPSRPPRAPRSGELAAPLAWNLATACHVALVHRGGTEQWGTVLSGSVGPVPILEDLSEGICRFGSGPIDLHMSCGEETPDGPNRFKSPLLLGDEDSILCSTS